ncbi:MAG TPA: hypothetical protein DEB39_14020 [Planctomycetaceae bacterium]|nr:hypothetical protein [Planctomycetaceae bacterium]
MKTRLGLGTRPQEAKNDRPSNDSETMSFGYRNFSSGIGTVSGVHFFDRCEPGLQQRETSVKRPDPNRNAGYEPHG